MKISQIARDIGVSTDTVRHYVDIGLLRPGRDPANGYRVFGERERSRLRFIKGARELGLQLQDIERIFEDAGNGDSPCPRVRELLEERLVQTRRRIEELTALCRRMEVTMEEWRKMPDSEPDGHSVCRLIESQMVPGVRDNTA